MRKNKERFKECLFLFLLIIILCAGEFYIYSDNSKIVYNDEKSVILFVDRGPHEESLNKNKTYEFESIPQEYLYRNGNLTELRNYLINKNSNLANEPYFTQIVDNAQKYNLNPCLLFAITGREQSFVPKDHKFVSKISNNPFNVFGSWEKYNTTINDSAAIACRTIINLSKSRTPDINFLEWINSRNGKGGYAEDAQWHKDVEFFFELLNTKIY